MLELPFTVLNCSWPRPVQQVNGCWISEPDWEAPVMPGLPPVGWEIIDGDLCWTIDWRNYFKGGLKMWDTRLLGEMRGFQVIFRLQIKRSGKLVFYDDDGCIIRRKGEIIHSDRNNHDLTRHEIEVGANEQLEVAQWQYFGNWLWGGRLDEALPDPTETLLAYRPAVEARLQKPNGPPLKSYTSFANPVRAVVAIYSMVLNGYSPDGIYLFGEDQWSGQACALIAATLPFAQIVPTSEVLDRIERLGGFALARMALGHWFVMQKCVAMLCPPDEFCLMDDDIFVLDRVNDALTALQDNDIAFSPDLDHGEEYINTWVAYDLPWPLPTARLNAGLYWTRNSFDQAELARYMLKTVPNPHLPFLWGQGFMATTHARKRTVELPSQRYFFPLQDGLPGGIGGYDYASNPCGFATIHFAGLQVKPTDRVTLRLVPQILNRMKNEG